MMRQSTQFKTRQKQFWRIGVLLTALLSITAVLASSAYAFTDEPQHVSAPAVAQAVVQVTARPDPLGLIGYQDAAPAFAPAADPAQALLKIPLVLPAEALISPPGELARVFMLRGSATSGVQQIILQEFAGTGAGPRAIRVARCESTLKPGVVHRNRNGTHDHGLFQLNDGGTAQTLLRRFGYAWNALYSARANAKMARALWSQTHSFARWTCG